LVLFPAVLDDRLALLLGLAEQSLMQRAHNAPSPVAAMRGAEHGCRIIAAEDLPAGCTKLWGGCHISHDLSCSSLRALRPSDVEKRRCKAVFFPKNPRAL